MRELLSKNDLTSEQAFALCEWLGNEIDLQNINGRSLDLPKPFHLSEPVKDEMILFPGSFNPWHLGHRECLVKCPKGPIAIIPDRNPWKEFSQENPWQDVCIIREQLLSFERDDIFIDPGFLAKVQTNPTVNWLPHINVEKKWLLMGDDVFLGLHRWHDYEIILKNLHGLYVCPRLGNKVELEIQRDSLLNEASLEVIFLNHHDYEDISSTELRRQ
jgi:nicotinate-nucleotide adenylyltransferase